MGNQGIAFCRQVPTQASNAVKSNYCTIVINKIAKGNLQIYTGTVPVLLIIWNHRDKQKAKWGKCDFI